MDIKELRDKTDLELDRLLVELRDKTREQRFNIAARQLSNVRQTRDVKRTIARIMTLKKQRVGTAKKA